MALSSPSDGRSLDPYVWRACAGATATIPSAGSFVYYFPQGHVEHSSSPPDLDGVHRRRPFALCLITAVAFSADPDTDEVFVRISLDPRIPRFPPSPSPSPDLESGGVSAFAKSLTASDANNGGGFSVPRFCAESIFPPLNYKAEPPMQNISVRDMHGKAWEFRHIYRGTPRRHLLTTGWSKFVNSKKLVAGDSVVFMKKLGELFVGVRRVDISSEPVEYYPYNPLEGPRVEKLEEGGVKGRIPAVSVAEAIRAMEMDRPFEVSCFPKVGLPEFVVAAETVEAAMKLHWRSGMRVRMQVETVDMRTTWFQGTVTGAVVQDVGPWPGSPWRMLQVSWDDPEVMKNTVSASPWQVELLSATTHLHAPYPTTKKLRVLLSPEFLSDREGNMVFPLSGSDATKMGNLPPSLYNHHTFPAGMQGARHDFCVYNFIPRNTHQIFSNELCGINMPQNLENVSTNLSIGNASQLLASSPLSENNIHVNGTELLSASACNQTRKASERTFQLFGQIIHMKGRIDGDNDTNYGDTKSGVQSVDFPLAHPHKKLHNGLDVQY